MIANRLAGIAALRLNIKQAREWTSTPEPFFVSAYQEMASFGHQALPNNLTLNRLHNLLLFFDNR
jgi:hypothetical protein